MTVNIRRIGSGLAALALGASLVALAGCGSAANTASAAAAPTAAAGPLMQRNLKIVTGAMLHKPGWPQYQPAFWTVAHVGDSVVVTITSYDDGTAPLTPGSPYARVQGTLNGTETVDGRAVTSIPVGQVAHTFTIPALGVNLVVPAAPKGKTVTVQATIRFSKAGVFDWYCMAPCGTGTGGMGGPMVTPGWMTGTVTVAS